MMNEKAQESVRAYDAQAGKLCELYNKLSTTDVLPGIESVLPVNRETLFSYALDLGCGSGRDSAWLRSKGFQVIGVDASTEMLKDAWNNNMTDGVAYVLDEMPELKQVKMLNKSGSLEYDFYLMSASWMHLDTPERVALMGAMNEWARPNATAYISLRHGPSPADRPMFDTSVEEVQDLAAQLGAASKVLPATPDQQGRGEVTWDYVAIQFHPTKRGPKFG